MNKARTEIRVGVAILVAAILLIYMTFSVGGLSFFDEDGMRIQVVFHSVSGLGKKAPVQISGVTVGQVESVELVEEGARAILRIDSGVKIKNGGYAAVKSSGVLGDRFVEIVPGTGPELLADGQTLAAQDEAPGMEDLMNRFSNIADDVKAVTTVLRAIFEGGKLKESLDNIMASTESLTRQIDEFVKENRASLGRSVSNVESFTATLNTKGGPLLDKGTRLIDQGNELMASLNEIAQKVRRGEGTIGKLVQDEAAYNRLNSALDDLGKALKGVESITKKIEKGEGTVGKLFADDTAYENLNVALSGVGRTLGRIERFKTHVGFKTELPLDSDDAEQKGYFDLRIQPRADKYYLLGIVNDPRGKVTESTRVVTVNGVPTTITELETERKVKLSAQFGKRVDNIDMRIGLIENTAGLGLDYAFWEDRLRVSLDAWDFSSDDPEAPHTHLKFATTYTLLKHIELSAGYDQMLNNNLQTFFVGLGVHFEDDDLKYLLGSLSGLVP